MARCTRCVMTLIMLVAAACRAYAQQDLCPQFSQCTWQFAVPEQQLASLGWDSVVGRISSAQLSMTVKCARAGRSSSSSISAPMQCAAGQVSTTSSACSIDCDNPGNKRCIPTTFSLKATSDGSSNLALLSSDGTVWFTCTSEQQSQNGNMSISLTASPSPKPTPAPQRPAPAPTKPVITPGPAVDTSNATAATKDGAAAAAQASSTSAAAHDSPIIPWLVYLLALVACALTAFA